jgi:glyoxylase-like metal-dependent hydrolase (beta-lactamase superfamily II)
MRSRSILAVLVVAVFASVAAAQDARTTIAAASKAMGADTLNTIEFSATGFDFAVGQAYSGASPWPKFVDKTYTRQVDFRVPSSKVDRIRMQGENPPRGGGQQPVRGEQPQNQTIVVGANTPWVQQLEIWMLPHGFLRAAGTRNATAKTQTVGGRRYTVVSFAGANNAAVNGYINDQNIVDRVETWIDNPVLGDTLFEAVYSDYRDFGGVKFPMHIVQRQGGYPILDLTLGDVKPNAPVTIQAPGRAGGAPGGGAAAGGAQTATATPSEKLADGVYLILGGYASVAVDFKDYIVVIEGATNDDRANAVIAEAKRLIPNKPIRYVVNTHQHFDHSGGLRAFVAEGATIVTHDAHKAYYEKVWAAPHTLSPDRLAKAPRKPTFETVSEKKVLTDGNHVVELHHLQGSGHNAGLLVAYLPKEKILIEADAFNPPADKNAPVARPASPYTMNLVDNMKRLKLEVNRIIPIHYPPDNRVVDIAELNRATSDAGTN